MSHNITCDGCGAVYIKHDGSLAWAKLARPGHVTSPADPRHPAGHFGLDMDLCFRCAEDIRVYLSRRVAHEAEWQQL